MGSAIRLAIAVIAASLPGLASAEAKFRSADVLPMTPLTARHQQECWVEHVQVQPTRSRAVRPSFLGNPTDIVAKDRSRDEHLGAEHWTADAQRACKLKWTPNTARADYDNS